MDKFGKPRLNDAVLHVNYPSDLFGRIIGFENSKQLRVKFYNDETNEVEFEVVDVCDLELMHRCKTKKEFFDYLGIRESYFNNSKIKP